MSNKPQPTRPPLPPESRPPESPAPPRQAPMQKLQAVASKPTSGTLTINRQCTRCPRVQQTEVSIADVVKAANNGQNALDNGPHAMVVGIDEKCVVDFPFLCDPCRQIVARYIEHIAKKPTHKSALRNLKIVEEDKEDD